jgi:hypothetical protein
MESGNNNMGGKAILSHIRLTVPEVRMGESLRESASIKILDNSLID